MRRPWCATLFVLAWSCAGCGSTDASGTCFPILEYHVTIDVTDAPRDSCILVLSSPTRSVPFTVSTLPDNPDGRCTDPGGGVVVPIGYVPIPDACSVTPCTISFDYGQHRAEKLRDLLGAEVLTLTAACGGQQLASETVEPTRWDCAL